MQVTWASKPSCCAPGSASAHDAGVTNPVDATATGSASGWLGDYEVTMKLGDYDVID
jgi:hypothetical protein